MPLDKVHDRLGVGLGCERVPLLNEPVPSARGSSRRCRSGRSRARSLAAGKRVRVLLGHAAVRRPARVAEPVSRLRAVRARRHLQVLEVADRADVVEPVILDEREAGRVIAPVLETSSPWSRRSLHSEPTYPMIPHTRGSLTEFRVKRHPRLRGRSCEDRLEKRDESPVPPSPAAARDQPSSLRTRAAIVPHSASPPPGSRPRRAPG